MTAAYLELATGWYIPNFTTNRSISCLILSLTLINPLCDFSKDVSSKQRVQPYFFVTFNIIISHIFPENFIGIPQVAQKVWRFFYINATIIYSYEKGCLPIFDIKSINCGPNLYFQSFLLFITDYYWV